MYVELPRRKENGEKKEERMEWHKRSKSTGEQC
jgi:hypothetical protein